MSVIGGRQVTGWNGRNPSGKQAGYALNMKGFWLRDNCRIIAAIDNPTLIRDTPYRPSSCPRLDQQFSHLLVALLGGKHQGGLAVLVLGIDLGPLGEEGLHYRPVAPKGGIHQGG